jgi:hypothetical protein
MMNGKGKMYYNDGTIYIGEFINNKRDGPGEMHKDGLILFQTYKNDVLLTTQ